MNGRNERNLVLCQTKPRICMLWKDGRRKYVHWKTAFIRVFKCWWNLVLLIITFSKWICECESFMDALKKEWTKTAAAAAATALASVYSFSPSAYVVLTNITFDFPFPKQKWLKRSPAVRYVNSFIYFSFVPYLLQTMRVTCFMSRQHKPERKAGNEWNKAHLVNVHSNAQNELEELISISTSKLLRSLPPPIPLSRCSDDHSVSCSLENRMIASKRGEYREKTHISPFHKCMFSTHVFINTS